MMSAGKLRSRLTWSRWIPRDASIPHDPATRNVMNHKERQLERRQYRHKRGRRGVATVTILVCRLPRRSGSVTEHRGSAIGFPSYASLPRDMPPATRKSGDGAPASRFVSRSTLDDLRFISTPRPRAPLNTAAVYIAKLPRRYDGCRAGTLWLLALHLFYLDFGGLQWRFLPDLAILIIFDLRIVGLSPKTRACVSSCQVCAKLRHPCID